MSAAETPLFLPSRAFGWRAPFRWLRAGWRDLCRAPAVSLGFGVAVALVSAAVAALGWQLGRFALLAALLSGFVFIAPLLAAALYEVSRELEACRRPTFAGCLARARRVAGQAAVFALAQMVVLLLWSRAGMVVNALVTIEDGSLRSLLEFLAIGSAIGAVFATVTFAASAFSLPLVADRDVDMVTALVTSVNAVLRNKPAALVWALLICAITALGLATAFVGLVVAMPWLAFATWHAYRDVIDASAVPRLD